MSAIGNFETAQPDRGDARRLRPAVRLEAVAARRRRRRHQPEGRPRDVPGDQRPPRRRLDRLPGPLPLRQDPADPRRWPRGYQADWTGRDRSTDIVGSGHPDILRPPCRRQGGLRRCPPAACSGGAPAGWPPRPAGRRTTSWSLSPTSPATAGPTCVVRNKNRQRRRAPRHRRRRRSRHDERRPPRSRGYDQVTAVGDLNGDGHNDLVARQASTGRLLRSSAATATGAFPAPSRKPELERLQPDRRRRRPQRRRARPTWSPATRPARSGCTPAPASPCSAPGRRSPGSWAGYDAITGGGDFTGDGKADLYARQGLHAARHVIFPGRGNGTFGHRLRPVRPGQRPDRRSPAPGTVLRRTHRTWSACGATGSSWSPTPAARTPGPDLGRHRVRRRRTCCSTSATGTATATAT